MKLQNRNQYSRLFFFFPNLQMIIAMFKIYYWNPFNARLEVL